MKLLSCLRTALCLLGLLAARSGGLSRETY